MSESPQDRLERQQCETDYYCRHKSRIVAIARARKVKKHEFIRAYLLDHPCKRCGVTDFRVLQFHHRDRGEKKFTIGEHNGSIENIRLEIEKCDVLCANCHLIVEDGIRNEQQTEAS